MPAMTKRHWWLGLLGLAAVIVVVVIVVTGGEDPDPTPADPHPESSFRIVSLGDSYISGEGARVYLRGTDEPGGKRNMCHRARTAYSYRLADELGASLTFVACSGAETAEVTNVAQYPRSPEGVYGGRPQIEVLREIEDPDVVLISIGGNDAGFAEIGLQCAVSLADCRRLADRWLRRLDSDVYPALVRTYLAVREAAPGAEVLAMTYPNPIGPQNCNQLIGVAPAEMNFIRDVFVGRLNEIVTAAAAAAGVRSVDLTGSLAGHRFCEARLGETAINFIDVSRTRGTPINVAHLGGLAAGTLHPNKLGHELLGKVVGRQLDELRAGTLPPASEPDPDKKPPPFVPKEIGAPGVPRQFPPNTDCNGTELSVVTPMSAQEHQRQVELTGVRPRSTVCFRTYQGDWDSKQIAADGTVRVPIDVSRPGVASINEILVEDEQGNWKELVVSLAG